jgi:hypothetical protein
MPQIGSARLNHLLELAGVLDDLAVDVARSMRKKLKAAPRSRGATLRPGVETPLWLALVEEMQPWLRRRGAKALLANELALHRSQISKFFVSRSAMPDAERTLELLLWLARQRAVEKR